MPNFLPSRKYPRTTAASIELPLNFRYNFSLPLISKVVVPYLGVGPSVSFLTSRKNIHDAYRNRSVDWALNFGFGLRFLSHIDINARYGLGLTKAVRAIDDEYGKAGIEGKTATGPSQQLTYSDF